MDRVTKVNVQTGRRKERLTKGVRTQVQSTTEQKEMPKPVHKANKDDPSQPEPLVESVEDRLGGESGQRNGSTRFADRSISARRSLSRCAH